MRTSRKYKIGDVVLCRFPTEERPGHPGPKARPCLVVGVRRKTMFCRSVVVEVAFGTSVFKKKPGTAIFITSKSDLELAGLEKPSQFLLSKRARVQLRSEIIRRTGTLPDHWFSKIKKHLNDESVSARFNATRFGRKTQQVPWTMSSDSKKENAHA